MTGTSAPKGSRGFDALDRIVDRAVAGGISAVAGAVGDRDGTRWRRLAGHVRAQPGAAPLSPVDRFDLASLTKVLVAMPLVLRLVESGDLHLGKKVADLVPEFAGDGKGDITVAHLLTHASGLPAHVPFWRERSDVASVRARVLATPLVAPPATAITYSDLGYMILGFLIERIHGRPLDEVARKEAFAPLGLEGATFRPKDAGLPYVATEVVEERGGLVAGEVHDENAMALGGIAGHAGLFGTLDDVVRVARFWAGGGTTTGARWLSGASMAAAMADQTSSIDPSAARGLAWVRTPNPFAIPNDLASPHAVSHTGFTGTSIMVDPTWGTWAVLLTNRVHPTRHGDSPARIRETRATFHGAAWAALT